MLADFSSLTGQVEIHVLGLVGKLLTGPWMKKFYRGAVTQVDHVEGISMVKSLLTRLKNVEKPLDLLKTDENFFGEKLDTSDATLQALLRQPPEDASMFSSMMGSCLKAAIDVLDRQYEKYFAMDVTDVLKEETKSARAHNIDAEEIMGMFSAAQKKTPNATLCFLSSKLRAQKNRTVAYLDNMTKEKRDTVLKKAVKLGQLQRKKKKVKKDLMKEMAKRQADKQQARETTERNKLQKRLKNISIEELAKKFPDLDSEKLEQVTNLITGKSVGDHICHIWYEESEQVMYHGKIESLKSKGKKYTVAYWSMGETYDNATDYDMSPFALAADLIAGDLMM